MIDRDFLDSLLINWGKDNSYLVQVPIVPWKVPFVINKWLKIRRGWDPIIIPNLDVMTITNCPSIALT